MAGDLYCGKCHTWMWPSFVVHGQVAGWWCNCSADQQDMSKDPNCHNSTHDHHDPFSPIVLSRKAEYASEESAEHEQVQRTEASLPVFGFVTRGGPTDRPGSLFEEYPYHVAVFDSGTGEMLGWRPLREPKLDEETRAALDAILREMNERVED